jgi:protein-S-isoprenylcysteine O-methyltransferase Ste14
MTPWILLRDLWIFIVVVWLVGALRTKPIARRQPLAFQLVHRTLALAGWVMLAWPATAVGPLGWRFVKPDPAVVWVGVALTAAGIALSVWARVTLAGNWSANVTVKEAHELVVRGPYALVRHPIYSGITLACVGTAVAIGEVRGLAAVALVLGAWRLKWAAEERLMTEQFGDQYRDYRRRVRAIVPGLW